MKKDFKLKQKKLDTIIVVVGISLITVVAGLIVFNFLHSVMTKHALSDRGVEVMGVVDTRDVDGNAGRYTVTRRSVDYSFTPEGQAEVVKRQDFPIFKNEYVSLDEGSPIPITYLESDPNVNEPTVALTHSSPTYFTIASLVGLFGAFVAYNQLAKRYPVIKIKYRKGFVGFILPIFSVTLIGITGASVSLIALRLINKLLF